MSWADLQRGAGQALARTFSDPDGGAILRPHTLVKTPPSDYDSPLLHLHTIAPYPAGQTELILLDWIDSDQRQLRGSVPAGTVMRIGTEAYEITAPAAADGYQLTITINPGLRDAAAVNTEVRFESHASYQWPAAVMYQASAVSIPEDLVEQVSFVGFFPQAGAPASFDRPVLGDQVRFAATAPASVLKVEVGRMGWILYCGRAG